MGRLSFVVLVVLALAPGALSSACSTSNGGASDASTDYFGVLPGPEGGGGSDGDDGGGPPSITMRLAHLSPDVGPLDFCWRLTGATQFNGPVLGPALDGGVSDAATDAGDAAADASLDASGDGALDGADGDAGDAGMAPDASADGAAASDAATDAGWLDAGAGDAEAGAATTALLQFGELSTDVELTTAGTFDIALVPGGARTCARPITVQQVTLDPGKRSTVAIMGSAASDAGPGALAIVAFTDDLTADAQNARVRLIHAALGWFDGGAPAPSLSVSAGGAPPAPLAGELDPKHVSAMSAANPSVDALGYATVPPLTRTMLTLEAVGDASPGATRWQTADQLQLGLTAGSVHTGFIVSAPAGALSVLWCGEAKTAGSPTRCGSFPAAH